ncbi:MAG: translation initiation factor IF-2 [Bacteroidetes bacterium]|nr:translation initiation factor IF-2 [Bacteroidota bacterium]MCL5025298.1 translation initiation factor IF-2 [Chloroflexota bacterium]
MVVGELAEKLGVGVPTVIKELMKSGVMATVNQTIDYDTAAVVASDLGFEPEEEVRAVAEAVTEAEATGPLTARPPVVTIMGHVDHGKTSLLDAIRKTNVTEREAGGITQHIGAYQVEIHNQRITFLDTPGHEAFTAMRARGAQVTDIAVLVVAADDGVMPQTLEAIAHARAANVPIIVAINKIDRPDANPDRVKQQLADAGLIVEEWGGDVIAVPVSAKTKVGIETLLEMVLLVAEIAELKADASGRARGVVIEAQLDKTRGPLATVLVQKGTLKVGDNLVAGLVQGKVRAMFNDRGRPLRRVEPATPAVVLGLDGVPQAGDIFEVVADDRAARSLAAERSRESREGAAGPARTVTLDEIFEQMQAGQVKELNIVLKTDVQGSLEPIATSLERLSRDEVKINIIHQGTGNITESDVLLAQASKGIIVGFNVRVEPGAKRAAEAAKVDIRLYEVIYNLVEEVEKALTGMLEPKYVEVLQGRAEVRQTFRTGRGDAAAGCMVTDGVITRGAQGRVLRGQQKVGEGRIISLRRFKDDVREVAAGYECGIVVEGLREYQVGDVIEAYGKVLQAGSGTGDELG